MNVLSCLHTSSEKLSSFFIFGFPSILIPNYDQIQTATLNPSYKETYNLTNPSYNDVNSFSPNNDFLNSITVHSSLDRRYARVYRSTSVPEDEKPSLTLRQKISSLFRKVSNSHKIEENLEILQRYKSYEFGLGQLDYFLKSIVSTDKLTKVESTEDQQKSEDEVSQSDAEINNLFFPKIDDVQFLQSIKPIVHNWMLQMKKYIQPVKQLGERLSIEWVEQSKKGKFPSRHVDGILALCPVLINNDRNLAFCLHELISVSETKIGQLQKRIFDQNTNSAIQRKVENCRDLLKKRNEKFGQVFDHLEKFYGTIQNPPLWVSSETIN